MYEYIARDVKTCITQVSRLRTLQLQNNLKLKNKAKHPMKVLNLCINTT